MFDNNGKGARKPQIAIADELGEERKLHPAWRAFVRYCLQLKHGEIQLLKIQDGLPVIAEVTKKKVKFAP